MKFLTTTFVALALLSFVFNCEAATLLLREQASEHGSLVRLGDVADIAAATPAEVQTLSNTPLFPAPAVGTQFYLTVEKLRDLLVARGLDTGQLSIKGSLVVEIGQATEIGQSASPSPTVKNSSVAPTKQAAELSADEARMRIGAAIQDYLHSTTSAGRWRVEVSLSKTQLKQFEALGHNFSARELQSPRSGRVRFELIGGPDATMDVIAELTHSQTVVVAKRAIARGELVRAVDVELREREGNLPGGTLTTLQEVVGKVAQRSFKPNDVFQHSYLRAPWLVRRGETVSTFVRTGGIVVRSRAIAKQNGAMGELIAVETLSDKQRLDVTVSGPSEVTIYATGGRATDYASLTNRRVRR